MSEALLNKFFLHFSNIDFEKKYRQEYFGKSIVSLRISLLVVSALYALFAFFDQATSSEYYTYFFFIRFAIVIPIFMLVFAISFFRKFEDHWQLLISLCVIIGGSGIILMLLLNPGNIYYYGGMFLIFMGNYFLVKLRILYAMLSGLILILIYNIGIFVFNEFSEVINLNLLQANAFYISANVICMIALYNIERLSRKEYLNIHQVSEQQHEINEMNKNLEWQVKQRTRLLDSRNERLVKEIRHNKKIEKQLMLSKEKAEESDRLKSAFLANMSHEIRTPMNGILGFTELLSDPELSGEEMQQYIDIIKKSGDRMLDTVNDIIEISKIETGQTSINISEVNVCQRIRDLYNFFKLEVSEKNMKLLFNDELIEANCSIRTDSKMLDSILTNLIKNAIKYSDNGIIEIGCSVVSEDLLFYVKDTGIGIAEDKIQSIFSRFIQVDMSNKRAVQGAGLGLSISKAYVELLNGKIWLESKLGEGSTFYFTLPRTHILVN